MLYLGNMTNNEKVEGFLIKDHGWIAAIGRGTTIVTQSMRYTKKADARAALKTLCTVYNCTSNAVK